MPTQPEVPAFRSLAGGHHAGNIDEFFPRSPFARGGGFGLLDLLPVAESDDIETACVSKFVEPLAPAFPAALADVLGHQLEGQHGLARTLQIAGLTLNNIDLSFADTPAFDALGLNDRPTLALGMYHLRLFDRVAIDFDSRKVLFDLPRAAGMRPLDELFTRSM